DGIRDDLVTGVQTCALPIFGSGALGLVTTGYGNTALGVNAGSALTTGVGNILIGTNLAADTPASNTSNFLNIGNVIFATGMTGRSEERRVGKEGSSREGPAW